MTPAEKRRVVKIVNANVKLRKRAALADKYGHDGARRRTSRRVPRGSAQTKG